MNKVDLVVLGFLMRQDMHGYQIAEYFTKRGIEFWIKVSMPSVYKALSRLEESGNITGKVEVDDSNRARKVYTITLKGREYFRSLLDEIFFAEKFISPFDFWNAFRFLPGNISQEYFITLLQHRQEKMRLQQQEMEEKRKCHEEEFMAENPPFYMLMLLEYLKNMHENDLHLLADLLAAAQNPDNIIDFMNMENAR